TVHRTWARQKVFIRRVIELAGLDFTIIPAGLWPEYYMLEPVRVMGDPDRKVSWSTGRIIPHVLSHPLSRNAICPVARPPTARGTSCWQSGKARWVARWLETT
ncbi:MAG: hypothetical protein WCE49_06845, partial [Terrimicrobiaceae bacterium]